MCLFSLFCCSVAGDGSPYEIKVSVLGCTPLSFYLNSSSSAILPLLFLFLLSLPTARPAPSPYLITIMATRPPQPMRPPPDREPRAPAAGWPAGTPSASAPASNPPAHAPPKEATGSSHANISHAELSAKYTNLKKRYFALDDVSARTPMS